MLSLMTEKPKDVAKFFWDHLEKDIGCLAEALCRNTENATVTVHLFLQHLSNSTTGKGTFHTLGGYQQAYIRLVSAWSLELVALTP